jgi:thiol-disulfide isomerase/thioredoxin
MSRIVELSAPQFARFVAKGSSVVVFSASWCKPCQEMKPVFHALEEKLHSLAVFGKIDVAVSPTIAQIYEEQRDGTEHFAQARARDEAQNGLGNVLNQEHHRDDRTDDFCDGQRQFSTGRSTSICGQQWNYRD